MENLNPLGQLKSTLEEAAFLVSTAASPKETHAVIVKALVLLSRLEDIKCDQEQRGQQSMTLGSSTTANFRDHDSRPQSDDEEARKVRNRLRLWCDRPQQINTRILMAYLELKRSGVTTITEPRLRATLPSDFPFDSNFAQMKIIAERNHGKIFETHSGQVTIWPPVETYVRDFESQVFKDSTGLSGRRAAKSAGQVVE